MTPIKTTLFKVLTLCVLLFTHQAFAAGFFQDDSDVIWKSGTNQYIKYARQDSPDSGLNEHPVALDAKQISLALEALKIWKTEGGFFSSGNEESTPVLTLAQTRVLGQNLATALRQANAEQDIIFALEKSEKKLLGLTTNNSFVAGRAFYKAGKLNLIIGDYNKPRETGVETVYDPTNTGITRYHFNHGSRERKSKRFNKSIHAVTGVENKERNGTRLDWFVMNVSEAAAAFLASKNRKDPAQVLVKKAIKEEADKIAKERREMRLEMARMRKEMKQSGQTKATGTMAERLLTLKELRDKELISAEEYQRKRSDVLSDI